jgi:putative restriction endonuclease
LVWALRASSQLFTFFRNAMASSKTLEQAIAHITIWRKGEQRAPHKPLLLLYVLANYQQGHARLFDYGTEVHEQLLSLLERFGPQRKAHYPVI